jgi:hypothetical protein
MKRVVLAALLATSACARVRAPKLYAPDRDRAALAQAFAWIVRMAPPARRYVFNVEGAPPSAILAMEAASVSGLVQVGSHFENPNAQPPAASLASITAGRPVWSDPPDQVQVEASYNLGQASLSCVLVLHPRTDGAAWTVTALQQHVQPGQSADDDVFLQLLRFAGPCSWAAEPGTP